MAGISSLGVGSGIDVNGIVDQLIAAERKPAQTRLDRRETRLQAELSSFGTLKSALSDFQSAVEKVSDAASFRTMSASSSNETALSIETSGFADAAGYDVEVNALAQSQSVASGAFESSSSTAGSGTLTFRFGAVSTDANGAVTGFTQNGDRPTASIDIPADASTLEDVRDAVNDAEIGVRASIINDGSGERLVFSSAETGVANGFVVDVQDDDGVQGDDQGLSRLEFNTSNSALALNRSASDAELTVDGLAVTRSGNEISDLIDGVTLTLNETTTAPAKISIEQDKGAAKKLIKGFVDAYNTIQSQIDKVSGYDAESRQGGVLQGNAVVRSVQSGLRRLMTDRLTVLEGDGIRALADLGITTNGDDGQLEIDSDRLDQALATDFERVGALFGVSGLTESSGFRFESSRSATRAGRYDVSVSQIAERASVAGASISAPSPGSPLVIDGSNDALAIEVDGVATDTLTLTRGSYTSGAGLAAEIQARINGDANLRDAGVTVTVDFDTDSGQLSLTSTRYGSASAVSVKSVDTATASTLGFSAGLSDTGLDVQGTINGVAAEGFGRYLTAQSGDAEGLKLEITGQQPGNLERVTFSRGVSDRLKSTLDGYLGLDGLFEGATDRIKGQIEGITDEREELSDRISRLEDRYIAQFTAMDTTVAQLNQTSTYLSGQLAGLEKLAARGGGK